MRAVVDILMDRDGMTCLEAKELIAETRAIIIEDPWSVDSIMADQLGLEPDYVMDVLIG